MKLFLAVISGILFGLSFPPFESGILAAAAFVPLLILLDYVGDYRETFLYAYVTFFVANCIAVYWAGGFTHGKDVYLMVAGTMLLIAHPVFFCIPIVLWMVVRRHFGIKPALIAFPFFWVAFEYFHASGQLSFPWLTLGNSQTYDLAAIQFASYTGVYGISFWLLWLNVLLFLLYAKLSSGAWNVGASKPVIAIGGIILLYLLPKFYGGYALQHQRFDSGEPIRVGVVQPDIDPFEKWGRGTEPQISILQSLTRQASADTCDLILWPETAITFPILLPAYDPYLARIRGQIDSLRVPLLTGLADLEYYRKGEEAPKTSKTSVDGDRYDTYNSSILLTPGNREVQKYAKMELVPFAERVPFSEELSFLNVMQWNFGMGGWGVGKEATVFHLTRANGSATGFSNMICYESVFPGFVASFVRNGAQFLTVITNDSWWGNTSGAYQHKQFAVLRAVENRRWVIQCANGGISCFIDPFGHILHSTAMYERVTAVESIRPQTGLTFYSAHGDWLAEICLVISAFFLTAAAGRKFYIRIRRQQTDD
jgi:apolipoprotein N-acyltransferase